MFDTAQVWHQCAFENTNKRWFFVVNDRLAQLEVSNVVEKLYQNSYHL